MSLSALTLTAALPAAAGLAQSAVEVGGQLGSGFLNMLSGLTESDPKDAAATKPHSGEATGPGDAAGLAKHATSSKIQSWSEKLISWLRQHRTAGSASQKDLEMELSLDMLDQPHVSVKGADGEAIESALADDPTLLQEFRELALDRSNELGGAANGSLSASPLSLKITHRDGDVQAAWQ